MTFSVTYGGKSTQKMVIKWFWLKTNCVNIECLHLSLFFLLIFTSLIDPCPQMVMAGKSMLEIGLFVVLRVVTVGSACQVSYAYVTEMDAS